MVGDYQTAIKLKRFLGLLSSHLVCRQALGRLPPLPHWHLVSNCLLSPPEAKKKYSFYLLLHSLLCYFSRRIISHYFQPCLLHSYIMDLTYFLSLLSWYLWLGNGGIFVSFKNNIEHWSISFLESKWRRWRIGRSWKTASTQLYWGFGIYCRWTWTPNLQWDHHEDSQTAAQALSFYIRISTKARQANVSQADSDSSC